MHPEITKECIQKYVGLPFKTHGRGPGGFDCWGLVCHIYKEELGIILPDFSYEYMDVDDRDAITSLYHGEKSRWTRVETPQPLDCVMFNIFGRPVHIGVVAFDGYFLHAPEGDFSRLERLVSPIWKRRIEGFYRHG